MMLLTWANLAYYQELMAGMREAIARGEFRGFPDRTKATGCGAREDPESAFRFARRATLQTLQ